MVNVMIVEDQKLVRSILESYIKKEEGYELLSSIPGADRAADICDACRIDLILMDVQTERRENGPRRRGEDKGRPPGDKNSGGDIPCGLRGVEARPGGRGGQPMVQGYR